MINMTNERTPRTLNFEGRRLQVEELNLPLLFARKPADLGELAKWTGREQHRVYVIETRELTPAEFDAFACNLLESHDWLNGKGGRIGKFNLCVEITAPGRPHLYVNPEGSDYARYVACLG